MDLVKTTKYSIKENKFGFIDLYQDTTKIKRLGHKLFLNKIISCDENNFIISFNKMSATFEHYDVSQKNMVVTAFKTTSPSKAAITTLELSQDIYGICASNKYGCSYVLYNWQTKKYYQGHDQELPIINDLGEIVISKKIKYDSEEEGLYFEDDLSYSLSPETFEIKSAYSELQQRNINFENQSVKKTLKQECLENMRTLALYQKANLLKTREEITREYQLKRINN